VILKKKVIYCTFSKLDLHNGPLIIRFMWNIWIQWHFRWC